MIYLSIPGTSVPSENFFLSTAGVLVNKLVNKLNDRFSSSRINQIFFEQKLRVSTSSIWKYPGFHSTLTSLWNKRYVYYIFVMHKELNTYDFVKFCLNTYALYYYCLEWNCKCCSYFRFTGYSIGNICAINRFLNMIRSFATQFLKGLVCSVINLNDDIVDFQQSICFSLQHSISCEYIDLLLTYLRIIVE